MSGKRILVVEDEFLVGIEIHTILTDAGFDVTGPAMNIEAALTQITEIGFDAVVLDVNLGGQYSGDIAGLLSNRGIPFVFVTGYGRENLPPEVAKAPLIEKPFDETQLIETVRTLCQDKKTL